MARKEKSSSMGAYDEQNNPPSEETGSLAARRARLRNSLAGKSQGGQPTTTAGPGPQAGEPQAVAPAEPIPSSSFGQDPLGAGSQAHLSNQSASVQPAFDLEPYEQTAPDLAAFQQPSSSYTGAQENTMPEEAPDVVYQQGPWKGLNLKRIIGDRPSHTLVSSESGPDASPGFDLAPADEAASEDREKVSRTPDLYTLADSAPAESGPSLGESQAYQPAAIGTEFTAEDLQQALAEATAHGMDPQLAAQPWVQADLAFLQQSMQSPYTVPDKPLADDNPAIAAEMALAKELPQLVERIGSELSKQLPLPVSPLIPPESMHLLTHIDQSLHDCAVNLSALQKLGAEQAALFKSLSETLADQTLAVISGNLTSLAESLSGALEPMRAAGQLVPVIDQLIAHLEAREARAEEKMTAEQLITNLSDQLSTGAIDQWTFKCAYMAIFPDDPPSELLRRLVELLGSQRLSGDLFRAAYEAVQTAEGPISGGHAARAEARSGHDEEARVQLELLLKANEELREAIEKREREFQERLSGKENELNEAQQLMASRYEEFNTRYEELASGLNKREDEFRTLLNSKEQELAEKDSEMLLLRSQMEDLRAQTEDMVKDLQKQLADLKIANEASSQSPTIPSKPVSTGFFDPVPGQTRSLFDAAPAFDPGRSISQPAGQGMQQQVPETGQQSQAQEMQTPVITQPLPQVVAPNVVNQSSTQPLPVQTASQGGKAAPPPTTPFAAGSGSYGSGVRAQVFEVIVRQALAGAPWREICAGPMQVNNITPEEVESEVRRRQAMLNK